jgi:exodeoxyribonuclease VII large subunit
VSLFPPGEVVREVSLVRLSGEIARSVAGVGRVAVEGEVFKPGQGRGGRVWFTLKDRAAQVGVSCPANRAARCHAEHGVRVRVTGSLVWLADRGQLQLEAEEVVPVRAGDVAALVAGLRRRLAAEGLLDRPRRPIPRLPAAVGVVCGADAAVRADIQSVVDARFPGFPLVFREVTVSGPGAADAIVAALEELDADPRVEVVVLARGGGDAAQLLPFSDEALCRAIARVRTAVVSAVGHEGDRPLCDELADLRCGTPSMAAAAVVPDRAALEAELDRLLERAGAAAGQRLGAAATRLAGVDRDRAVTSGLAVAAAQLRAVAERLVLVRPDRLLAQAGRRLDGHRRELDALSPARVLARGYAVVRTADGTVVRRAGQVAPGDPVRVELAAGRLAATVEEVEQ